MASVKVVDLNEATTKDEATPEPIEEATENNPEPAIDTANEIIEETAQQSSADCQEAPIETVEAPTPEPKPKVKAKAKPKASDIVPCPDCNKSMTYKNLRYSHKCSPEPPPVKPQAKPKGKAKPKPKPVPVYEEEEKEQHIPQQVIRQQPPPIVNPLTNIQQHYQLLQQQYMKQKQEKYNNLCQNMFKTKLKKR